MGLKTALTIQTLPRPSVNHVVFLQNLVETARFAEVFLPDFPHATRQALALPLAEPGMSWADITRHVYTLNYPLSKATWSEDRMGVVGVLGELVVQ